LKRTYANGSPNDLLTVVSMEWWKWQTLLAWTKA
jgi:hypothetical protein